MFQRQGFGQYQPVQSSAGRYAESAQEAWATGKAATDVARRAARGLVLSAASRFFGGTKRFVRCLYAHAVFPEQRRVFHETIRWLKGTGDFLSSRDLREIVRSGRPPDGRYYHLSFDDGFANVFEVGCDVLSQENVSATIFVAPSFIEADEDALAGYFRRIRAYRKPLRVMTWQQVREAVSAGMEIGSHTLTHARLSEISGDPRCLRAEVHGSKQKIEEATGIPCRAFAWPYGTMKDIDRSGFLAIEEAGYELGFSAVRGRVTGRTDVFSIPRHQIEFHWPPAHIRLWARGFRE